MLGSALATQDRISALPLKEEDSDKEFPTRTVSRNRTKIGNAVDFFLSAFRIPHTEPGVPLPPTHSEWENRPFAVVQGHLSHGITNIVLSLLGFAVLINSLSVLDISCSGLDRLTKNVQNTDLSSGRLL